VKKKLSKITVKNWTISRTYRIFLKDTPIYYYDRWDIKGRFRLELNNILQNSK